MAEISVVESIFLKALEQSRAERAAFLEKHCPDAQVRQEVERLLAAHAAECIAKSTRAIVDVHLSQKTLTRDDLIPAARITG